MIGEHGDHTWRVGAPTFGDRLQQEHAHVIDDGSVFGERVGVVGAYRGVHPVAVLVPVVDGQAEQLGEHDQRIRHRERGHDLDWSVGVGSERVEQRDGTRSYQRRQRADLGWRERVPQGAAIVRVDGWVARQQRAGNRERFGHEVRQVDAVPGDEAIVVARDLEDVAMAGHGPEAVAPVAHDGGLDP